MRFDGSGSTDESGIASFTRTFTARGEEAVLEGANPTYTFEELGTYKVTLKE